MMNKNEKKFRFNIVDVIVILIILCAVAVIGVSRVMSKNSEYGDLKDVEIVFYSETVSDSVKDILKAGDIAADGTTKVVFGAIDQPVFEESRSYLPSHYSTESEEGYKYIVTTQPDCSSVTVRCVVNCRFSDIGAVIDGNIYGVGHTLELLVGDARFSARVRDINVVEAE